MLALAAMFSFIGARMTISNYWYVSDCLFALGMILLAQHFIRKWS
jgi:hypothetical protein